jgi:competence protein ComEA
MRRRYRQDVVATWLRAAKRALGAFAVLILGAIALAAFLLPPAASAGGGLPPVRAADDRDPAAPPGRSRGAMFPDGLPTLEWGSRAGPAKPASREPSRPLPCAAANGFSGRVNLNRASERELDLLPGIGPAKARRIVAWRASHGPFRRIKDLRRVKGFGRKTVLKLFPYLTLDGPTTVNAAQTSTTATGR